MMKILHSFGYALKGIFTLFKNERNAQIHLILAFITVIFSIFFKISNTEWILVIISIAIVFAVEAINTAIEKTVDFISPEYHEKAGEIKDISAAAVLLVAIAVAIVGAIIFLPKVLNLFLC